MKRREVLKRGVALLGGAMAAVLVPWSKARAATVAFSDSFSRGSTSKGWGKAWFNQRFGMSWGIAKKKGFYDIPAPLSSATAFSPNPVFVTGKSLVDIDVTVRLSTNNPNGRFGLLARANGYANYYSAYLVGNRIRISRFGITREEELRAATLDASVRAGKTYNLRLKITGTDPSVQLKAKVWTGADEPSRWTVSATDATADRIHGSGLFGAFFAHDAVTSSAVRFTIAKFKASSGERATGQRPVTAFAFTGRVQPTGSTYRARVVAKIDIPGTIVFRYGTEPKLRRGSDALPDEVFKRPGVSKAWLPDLPPDTTIYWQAVGDYKGHRSRSEQRSFRTPPSGGNAASFAFGSCSHFYPVGRSFEEATKLDPLFFAHLGDFGYPDDVDGSVMARRTDTYQDRWTRMLMKPQMQHLHQKSLWIGLQDDHDYGSNNAWSQTVAPFTIDAFDQMSGNAGERHFDLRYGDLHAFFVDCHINSDDPAAPDGPAHSILGPNQKQWLKDSMNASSAALLVVFTSLPFWGSGPGDATWKRAFADERQALMEFFAGVQGPGRRVIICSGNSHAQYVNRHTMPNGKDIFEFVSSGTDRIDTAQSKPVPINDQVVDPQRAVKSVDAFGFVELDRPGPNRSVTLRSIDSLNGQNLWPPLVLSI